MSPLIKAFGEALHNLRSNFFQTILSVLGIIIGVGALVAMLSLIDGLEAFARTKIAGTTSIETVVVSSKTHRSVDEVRVLRDSITKLDLAAKRAVVTHLPYEVEGQLFSGGSELVRHPRTDSAMGVQYMGVSLPIVDPEDMDLRYGRLLKLEDEEQQKQVVVINGILAGRLMDAENKDTSSLIGSSFTMLDKQLEIVGVANTEKPVGLFALLPIELLKDAGKAAAPQLLLNFASVEDVQAGKAMVEEWLADEYAGADDPFQVISQEFWLEEMRKGFLLFRVVMGLIVGIAVVVGGVGVMNVLLMSITERTAEIGIRKAVGANRRTILSQFLAESVAISLIGSFFGILLGIAVAMLIAPILTLLMPELTFAAELSLGTILTVGIIAVITGIVFGTYPAKKAAGLDPVVAIQRS
jgi:ABC-type lipoprotein release transport system permease subunit